VSLYREDEGRDLCRKRGCEFKLPYPIIDINGCDSPQTSISVTSSTGDEKTQHQVLVRPTAAAGKKSTSATARNSRKRKKDGPVLSLYSTGNDLKSCSDGLQQFQATGDPYRGGAYHDGMGYGELGRLIVGCRAAEYDEEDMIKMRHDVTDSRCYYGNGAMTSAAAGGGAWYWGATPENTQLASYLYDQQRYLADYSMYGRLVTSPPPSLSNGGYDALPMVTTGALYEALTPPDDDNVCLQSLATTTTFPHGGDKMFSSSSSSYRRNDDTERFVANNSNNNNNNASSSGVTTGVGGVGHGGYGVATPVIQMSAKSRYRQLYSSTSNW